MVYQETYHEATYARHHLKGKKQDFFFRLETPDRLGRAGIDKIGLGALIGLSDSWRVDCYMGGRCICCGSSSTTGRAAILSLSPACDPAQRNRTGIADG